MIYIVTKTRKHTTDLGKCMKNKKIISSLQITTADQDKEISRLEQSIINKERRIKQLSETKHESS